MLKKNSMKHKIALIGFGTVGQGLTEILLTKKKYLKDTYKFDYDMVAVADITYGTCYNPQGLDIPYLLKTARAKKRFSKDLCEKDTLSLIKNCNADIVCELTYTDLKTGGPAMDHVSAALSSKKHVVTSNKGPAAIKYQAFEKLAKKNGVKFMIEGTVVAGTPVINLSKGPLAGCEISKIKGILNGTTNFMLTEMEKGMDYASVLKLAQQSGYAEADPSGDVEGYDARGKVCILANVLLGIPLQINDIPCRGITEISAGDIEKARKEGKRWKLIGCIENKNGKIKASVGPEMIELTHPLAGVMGANNALTFTTDMLGDVTIVGPGAGKTQTGFAILSDILAIHRG